MLGQRLEHLLDKAALVELLGTDVDREYQLRITWMLGPFCQLLAGGLQHPVAQGQDDAGFLGQRNEMRRRDKAFFGMLPTQQTFGTNHLAHFHLGLIEQLELTGLQTGTHVLLKRTALLQRRLQLGIKEATDIAPLALGLVHGHFSTTLHFFTRQFWLAKQAQAHADGD
ncbi:hypothetical protein SDC9_171223 [bioreactor metagenome]|uniref:Uncharacterized protein n=1 Tax=bioreactor metagenome TaxID=1076179 RepID=A0A645GCN0_9ZZZZ